MQRKGKIFTIIGREIAVAVKEGGPDPANNFKLAQVITKAKANNMPNDTIERVSRKSAGDVGNVNYKYVTYEGYGPNGIAIIVDALTDNQNRTAYNIRNALPKAREASEHRVVCPLCLIKRDRLSWQRKTARWKQMI